jgi:hypothetical protein
MSCNSQNYDSRSAYDQHMLKIYHSPVWEQNDHTRTHYDLDLQNQYLTNKNRFIPNFPNNFQYRDNQGKAPWDSFNNVMVTKENYAGNAQCNAPRTQFDIDMIHTYDTIGPTQRVVQQAPWNLFDNLSSEGNKVSYMCSQNGVMHGGGRHPVGGRGRNMENGVSTRGMN